VKKKIVPSDFSEHTKDTIKVFVQLVRKFKNFIHSSLSEIVSNHSKIPVVTIKNTKK